MRFCAVLCGLDKLDEIMTYQENNHENLRKDFGIEKFPSKSTFSRVLSMVDGKAVGRVLAEAGIAVEELGLHRQDLEDYFLERMGGADHVSF